MNKLSIIAKGLMITIGVMGIAHAKLNNWTGFYAGIEGGFAYNHAQLNSQQLGFTNPDENCNISSNFSTSIAGVQAGYSYLFPNHFVSGIEVNATLNRNQKNTLNCNSNINPNVYDRFTFKNQIQSAIKFRVGRVLNENKNALLPYLTAGASFANLGLTYKNEGNDYYSANTTHAGWLIGTGIEWAFMQNGSLRAEYYYINYGNAITLKIPSIYGLIDPNGCAHINSNTNNIVLTLNYWIE